MRFNKNANKTLLTFICQQRFFDLSLNATDAPLRATR